MWLAEDRPRFGNRFAQRKGVCVENGPLDPAREDIQWDASEERVEGLRLRSLDPSSTCRRWSPCTSGVVVTTIAVGWLVACTTRSGIP